MMGQKWEIQRKWEMEMARDGQGQGDRVTSEGAGAHESPNQSLNRLCPYENVNEK